MKNTRSLVVAVSIWLAVAAAPASAVDPRSGAGLYEVCSTCHGAAGAGNEMYGAPAIAGLPEWYLKTQLGNFRSGARGTHPDDVNGMRMRPMSLTLLNDDDVATVAAYVAAMPVQKPEPTLDGDAARGKTLFTPCIACHGPNGGGNQALFGPPINQVNDWYAVEQLKNFKGGIRGRNPKDTYGALMAPMAATLPDEQAMRDVAAYLATLGE